METVDVDKPQPERVRCRWVTDAALAQYHDVEWGQRPATDADWFERVVLETFQAGLSWRTILLKRPAFRRGFAQFEVNRVAAFGEEDVARLMADPGIVRNRKKVESALQNARIAQSLIREYGSLGRFFTSLPVSDLLRVLQKTFRFVGPTTAESIAIATGLLPAPHDHECWLAHQSHG
ncbi:DNA-3-methyladenine glycosylase I [Alicyclobacillus sp. ALC3]|uniref:DNA-3-methyladenine glycosylase I n=1 Tax=Alicyclobacillus sp. ALC3 TaxID=2796143 RepID=UPI0023797357|nr:DNA-3-methyladenine glycosylase I [Alicyclobacillus sp. ALC3]WDL98221.1 DNA-3-methyladenine glycosylase I [Alicyclobacillus sp. ALC3]